MRKFLQIVWSGLAVLLVLWFLQQGDHRLLDMPTIIMVFVPNIAAAMYAKYRIGIQASLVLLRLSIPSSLVCCMIGAISMLMSMDSPEHFFPAVSVMMLPILYGGTLTALGHFSLDKVEEPLPQSSALDTGICCGIYLLFFFSAMAYVGPFAFFDLASSLLLIFIVGAAVLFSGAGKGWVESMADGVLASTMLSVVFSIILFFIGAAEPTNAGPAMAIGCLGLLYGLIVHVCCFFFGLRTGEVQALNYGLKNWHLVELSSFFLFIFFAPPTLMELIQ